MPGLQASSMLIETVVYKICNKNGMLFSGKYILVVIQNRFYLILLRPNSSFLLACYINGHKVIALVVKISITLKVKKLLH